MSSGVQVRLSVNIMPQTEAPEVEVETTGGVSLLFGVSENEGLGFDRIGSYLHRRIQCYSLRRAS